ncbi:MAG: class I SAM-dependent rRNA methyltransferase, partial [Candidatus Methylomirabilis sp.]|nr:class I SAM-dependent rRNA methyltransferase [Deltaproteobacteria bacterium]
MYKELTISRGALARLQLGHLWVYANEVEGDLKAYEPGSVVDVLAPKGDFFARGYVNPHSLIAVRLLARDKVEIDKDFFAREIGRAADLRRRLYGAREAQRLVFGEGDWLPGLIVDRYGDAIAVQAHTLGIDKQLGPIAEALAELFSPKAIVLRNDLGVRDLEGAPQEKRLLAGDLPGPIEIDVDGVRMEVDLLHGQKTGFFLDQADNRARLGAYVRGGRVLDLFCYSGAWGLAAARLGATEVVFADSSEPALAAAERQTRANFPSLIARFVQADLMHGFKGALGAEPFDVVVVDPPAFARRKKDVPEARTAYRTLNSRALRMVRPGGTLVTCSCSYHI